MKGIIKLLSLMLLITLIFTLLSCKKNDDINNPKEESDEPYDGRSEVPFVFSLNSDQKSYTLERSYSERYRGDVIIPSEYNGQPVSAIGVSAFSQCDQLTSITIPESVKLIDSSAFMDCKKLTEITIPGSVTEIGYSAFWGCVSLERVTLYEGLLSIGNNAFTKCHSLVEISIPKSLVFLGSAAFRECSALTAVHFGSDNTELLSVSSEYYNYGTFSGCVSLKHISLPKGLKYIPDFAFSGCYALVDVRIPNGVTHLGERAFSYCLSLTSVTIPEGVKMIGKNAFDGCISLYEIVNKSELSLYPSNFYAVRRVIKDESESWLKNIDGFVFYDNHGDATLIKYVGEDTDLTLPTYTGGTKYKVATRIFSTLPRITGLVVPDEIISIDYMAFSDCTELVDFTVNCRDTEIDADYFGENHSVRRMYINTEKRLYCSRFNSLEEVHFGEGVTKIGEYALAGSTVRRVSIPATVTEICDYAFRNSNVSELIIAEGSQLEKIGHYAFSNCSDLRSVSFPNTLTSVEERAFEKSGIRNIDLGDGLLTIGASTFDNCAFDTITIPDSLISIGEGAFAHNHYLSTVAIGDGSHLQSIGDEAFYCCERLGTFTIPSELSYLGTYAFVGSALSYINLHEDNPYFEKIDTCLYSEDKSVFILCPQKGIRPIVTIPASVIQIAPGAFAADVSIVTEIIFEEGSKIEKIGEMAFMGAAITEITIPATVTEIGREAFSYCQSLVKVTFEEGTALTELPDGVFSDCYNLEHIIIPTEIVRFGEKAFFFTGIANVYYGGTIEMWEKIEKGDMWDDGMGDYLDEYTVHCADGKIEKKE